MDNFMIITSAKYNADIRTGDNCSVNIVVDGKVMSVPLNSDNRHYAEILRQVEAGTLTIADAD
mgnify:CR=1|tara:strand:- start:4 stop:192 length:189 start_codon:yes stop_codon:yes gene_type:complete